MIKLDAYDKKILEALIKNSREQLSSIGKKARLSRENVHYRIERLKRLGLIQEFNTVFDEELLGLEHYVVFLQLVDLKAGDEESLVNFLKGHRYFSWIGPAAGKWSLIFDIIVPNSGDLDMMISEILKRHGKNIGEYVLLKLQDGGYFDQKMLEVAVKEKKRKDVKIKLDGTDRKILSMLNLNSRTTYVAMSEKVGLTANGAMQRVKRLEDSGVIVRYTTSIDWKKLDYEWYGLQFNLTSYDEKARPELHKFLKKDKRVMFYYRYLGGVWDYDIGVIVNNSAELRRFINDFRAKFGTSIKLTDVFIVLEEAVGYKLPDGVF